MSPLLEQRRHCIWWNKLPLNFMEDKNMKVFLKKCDDCCERTIHTSKRNFNEVEYITTISIRCEICGCISTRRIDHNNDA